MREGKLVDIEALKALRKIRDQVVNKEDDQLPKELKGSKEAGIFYRNLKKDFLDLGMSEEALCKIILDIFDILKSETIIDWHLQPDTQRVIKNKLDDYLYDEIKINMDMDLGHEDLNKILEIIIGLALENNEIF